MSQATLPHLSRMLFSSYDFWFQTPKVRISNRKLPGAHLQPAVFIKIMICAKNAQRAQFHKAIRMTHRQLVLQEWIPSAFKRPYQCSMATVNLTSLCNKTAAYQHVSYNWLTSPQLVTVLFFAGPAGGQLCRGGFDPKKKTMSSTSPDFLFSFPKTLSQARKQKDQISQSQLWKFRNCHSCLGVWSGLCIHRHIPEQAHSRSH